MYYLWKYASTKKTRFFNCYLEKFEGDTDITWILGEKVEKTKLPLILKYHAYNNELPDDFPLTSSVQFLVSDKIAEILKRLNIPNVDYFDSEIILKNGKVIKGYSTLNIMNIIDCLDEDNSKFISLGSTGKYGMFKNITLFEERISEKVGLFRLKGHETLVVVNERVKEEFEKEGIIGTNLRAVIEGEPFLNE